MLVWFAMEENMALNPGKADVFGAEATVASVSCPIKMTAGGLGVRMKTPPCRLIFA